MSASHAKRVFLEVCAGHERSRRCASSDGVPYSPDYVTRAFREAVEATKLPRIRLHDLRHS
jgi:integrase